MFEGKKSVRKVYLCYLRVRRKLRMQIAHSIACIFFSLFFVGIMQDINFRLHFQPVYHSGGKKTKENCRYQLNDMCIGHVPEFFSLLSEITTCTSFGNRVHIQFVAVSTWHGTCPPRFYRIFSRIDTKNDNNRHRHDRSSLNDSSSFFFLIYKAATWKDDSWWGGGWRHDESSKTNSETVRLSFLSQLKR